MTNPEAPSGRFGPRARPPSGFTLIEMTVSVVIISVVLVAATSAILLAGKALPEADSPAQSALSAAAVAEQMASELQYAQSLPVHTDRCISFTVADRNGDEAPETIRYEWSGQIGEGLTRYYNSTPQQTVLTDVRQFQLAYELVPVSEQPPSGNESAEMLLASYDVTSALKDYSIKIDRYPGEHFHPSLPADTVSWRVTRVKFKAKVAGANTGVTKVQLCKATVGGLPSNTVLEEHLLNEQSLSSVYQWQEFTFSGVSGLLPTESLCLVLRHVSDTESCKVQYQDAGASDPNLAFLESTNGGVSWSALAGKSMLFYAYGRATTAATPSGPTSSYVRQVSLLLQAGDEASPILRTAASMHNCPEVTGQ